MSLRGAWERVDIPKLLEDAAYQKHLPDHPEPVEGQAVHGSTGLYVTRDF